MLSVGEQRLINRLELGVVLGAGVVSLIGLVGLLGEVLELIGLGDRRLQD